MIRPFLAIGALFVALTVIQPTLQEAHESVEGLEIRRDLRINFWKFDTEMEDPGPLFDHQEGTCPTDREDTYSEITDWPSRIAKDENFTLGGIVNVPAESDAPLAHATVDVFLNETKTLPGILLGTAQTDEAGRFELTARVPFDLKATRYHLVAHVHEMEQDCILYHEHWSDPEMDVTARTQLSLRAPEVAVVGGEIVLEGRLLDNLGAPVREANLTLRVGKETFPLTTDATGGYLHRFTPGRAGTAEARVVYEGDGYYGGAEIRREIEVRPENVVIDGAAGLPLARSRENVVTGRVLVEPGREMAPVSLRFDGLHVAACARCPLREALPVTPEADGRFEARVYVPYEAETGPVGFTVSDGPLRETYRFGAHVVALVRLEVDAEADGWFAKRLAGTARLLDDGGRPLALPLAAQTPTGWRALAPDSDGVAPFASDAECGERTVLVYFNGTETYKPAVVGDDATVCPLLAALDPFLLGLPWWLWLLVLAAASAATAYVRARIRDRAPLISDGPPLHVEIVAPEDDAPDVVAVHEPVALRARLEAPLPEGHALRIGTHGATTQLRPDDAHAATWTFVPPRLGTFHVRAEIVSPRGRVVTRRTQTVRAVRYAEEIESRYRSLQQREVGERADRVSPRDFERWLRERDGALDPGLASRLVGIFEEADYGPRDVGRHELLAYLRAERGVRRPA